MSETWTPTTEDVRVRYALDRGAAIMRPFSTSLADFDRWLAEHDRQVAERAWDEGHLCHGEDYRHPQHCRDGSGCIAENPYRAAKGEQK